jgi:hypothetical protein
VKAWRERWRNRKQKRLAKMHDQEQLLRAKIKLINAKKDYRKVQFGAAVEDWFAVFVGFLSFIFLIAWQEYPEWDPNAIFPTFIRAVLVAGPITLGMWGVARALRPGSSVPASMARKIPYGKLNTDGTVGGTDADGEDSPLAAPDSPAESPADDSVKDQP